MIRIKAFVKFPSKANRLLLTVHSHSER